MRFVAIAKDVLVSIYGIPRRFTPLNDIIDDCLDRNDARTTDEEQTYPTCLFNLTHQADKEQENAP